MKRLAERIFTALTSPPAADLSTLSAAKLSACFYFRQPLKSIYTPDISKAIKTPKKFRLFPAGL